MTNQDPILPRSEQTRLLMHEMAQNAEKEFGESLPELEQELMRRDPLLVMSLFAFYYLTTYIDEKGEVFPAAVNQADSELLQCIMLRHRLDEYKPDSITSDVGKIIELLQKVNALFHARDAHKQAHSGPQASLISGARANTQSVRNWGYPEQMQKIVRELFDPLDDEIEKALGIRVSHILKMFDNLEAKVQKLRSEREENIRRIFNAKDYDELKRTLKELLHEDIFEGFTTQLESEAKDKTLEQQKFASNNEYDQSIVEVCTLAFDDFVSAYPVPISIEKITEIISLWSIKFGEIKQDTVDLFLDNPVWAKPIIHVDHPECNVLLIPNIGTLHSFCLQMMEMLVASNEELKKKYEKRRSEYLEVSVSSLLEKHFPSAKRYKNIKWRDSNGKYMETDNLLILDTTALIVECKSGAISTSARRGGEKRLKHKLKELILDPSDQCNGIENYLRNNRIAEIEIGKSKETVDTSGIKTYVKFSITLELFAGMFASLKVMKEEGAIPKEASVVPSMCLADLEIVFDLLTTEIETLYYLEQRFSIENEIRYVGDELDLLVLYFQCGFHAEELIPDERTFLMIANLSQTLDSYYLQKVLGRQVEKPKTYLTSLWRKLIAHCELRKLGNRFEIGELLLRSTMSDQKMFEQKFVDLKKRIKDEKRTPVGAHIIGMLGDVDKPIAAIIGAAYKGYKPDDLHRLLLGSVTPKLPESVKSLIVIASDVDIDAIYSQLGYIQLK